MELKNETVLELIESLGLESGYSSDVLYTLQETDSRYLRDLKVNVSNVLTSDHLSRKETSLLALAIATNNKNQALVEAFKKMASEFSASPDEISEAMACASLLAANNVFYRFRHFVNKQEYNDLPGKIRMNIMMKPVLGKEFFELVSLAVSAVNGCEMCVKAHERSVLELGATEARVWDAVRLAAVVASLDRMVY